MTADPCLYGQKDCPGGAQCVCALPAKPVGLDEHDPAGMAAWLRERAKVNREFAANLPEPHVIEQWKRNVMPHLAFRFEQAADMIERLQRGEFICSKCGLRKNAEAADASF